MTWHAISHSCIALLLGTMPTTNPSSLTLTILGIGTFLLCYRSFARLGLERGPAARQEPTGATPQAAEMLPEERRVA